MQKELNARYFLIVLATEVEQGDLPNNVNSEIGKRLQR
jgi:hypothetical protein